MAKENRVENNLERNLHEVKEKLASDQNMLFNAFALETFYKKYKIYIFAFIALIIAVIAYFSISAYINSYHKEKMIELMNKIMAKDIDEAQKTQLLEQLKKEDSKLYDFYMLENLQKLSPLEIKDSKNMEILKSLMSSKEPLIADMATYQYAVFEQDLSLLESYAFATSPLLRDRARFMAAYLHLQKGEIALAHALLNSITKRDDNAQIYELATLLKHYGLDSIESKTESTIESKPQNSQDNKEDSKQTSFNIHNLDSTKIIESRQIADSKRVRIIESTKVIESKNIIESANNIESNKNIESKKLTKFIESKLG